MDPLLIDEPGRKVLLAADRRLTVPIPGPAESLNVAMAGAILLADLSRIPEDTAP